MSAACSCTSTKRGAVSTSTTPITSISSPRQRAACCSACRSWSRSLPVCTKLDGGCAPTTHRSSGFASAPQAACWRSPSRACGTSVCECLPTPCYLRSCPPSRCTTAANRGGHALEGNEPPQDARRRSGERGLEQQASGRRVLQERNDELAMVIEGRGASDQRHDPVG